jgi:hypothetical protein
MKVKVAVDVSIDSRDKRYCGKACRCLDDVTTSCFLKGDTFLGESLRVVKRKPRRTRFCLARQVR